MRTQPEQRAADLDLRRRAIARRPHVRYAFAPSHENDPLAYFPGNLAADLASIVPPRFVYAPPGSGTEPAQVIIMTGHGGDLSPELWRLRAQLGPETLMVLWHWDNHLAFVNNLKTSLACDYVFVSHLYATQYLFNPSSAVAGHIPACCGQWANADGLGSLLESAPPRRDELFVNYVDYPFSWRRTVLRDLAANMPNAHVRLMDPSNRSAYFAKTTRERFVEWLGFKATIILPIHRDLSTRFFDALYAGLVVIVPNTLIEDLDRVVPVADQEALGIVRIGNTKTATIREATAQAVRNYDEQGLDGVRRRHHYVASGHMLAHRVAKMLTRLFAAEDGFETQYGTRPVDRAGLRLARLRTPRARPSG